MYTPDRYKNTDQEDLFRFVTGNGFGVFITQHDGIPFATQIPMEIEKGEMGFVLTGHISKENGQTVTLVNGAHALAIFSGPHAYVSSSWYNHENVSTWNYIAVQAAGRLEVLDQLALIESLIKLTEKYESKEKHPKYFGNIDERVIRDDLTGIVGFRIIVPVLEGSFKLSQNRNNEDYRNIIHKLEERGDENSMKIAGEMRKRI